MAKAFIPVILSANDLREGWAVFLTPAGWSRSPEGALRAGDAAAAEALLQRGKLDEAARRVVGCYHVEVESTGRPLLLRERIRAEGPTHRADLRRPEALPEAA